MENERIINQFEKIEQKVEKLIETCKSYQTANIELKKKINLMEEELRKKVEAERNFNEERALILSKVDGLLDKLEVMTKEQQD